MQHKGHIGAMKFLKNYKIKIERTLIHGKFVAFFASFCNRKPSN